MLAIYIIMLYIIVKQSMILITFKNGVKHEAILFSI
jgi:hypothetical protein